MYLWEDGVRFKMLMTGKEAKKVSDTFRLSLSHRPDLMRDLETYTEVSVTCECPERGYKILSQLLPGEPIGDPIGIPWHRKPDDVKFHLDVSTSVVKASQ